MTHARSSPRPDAGDRPSLFASLNRRPLTRVIFYYLTLVLLWLILREYAPWVVAMLTQGEAIHGEPGLFDPSTGLPLGPVAPGGGGTAPQAESLPVGIGVTSLSGMVSAYLLMLPVVWIYQLTRQKRGYQQSLVQTLMILPIVVAATVSLVRNSVALAFSLGGIVGAVAFRNRLEDTKDAVYVFLAIAVGLAAGVQVFPVAVSLSVFYNFVALTLWYTDFGRVPAALTGQVGQRRIELARELATARGKQTGEFVSAVDEQILQSMTPDQLEALAEKAVQRKQKMSGKLFDTEERVEGILAVVLATGASEEALRKSVEQVLEREAKEWQLEAASLDEAGRVRYNYRVRTKKSVPRPLLIESVRRATIGQADQVVFE